MRPSVQATPSLHTDEKGTFARSIPISTSKCGIVQFSEDFEAERVDIAWIADDNPAIECNYSDLLWAKVIHFLVICIGRMLDAQTAQ